jgi:Domain of unknown function (DUF4386)
MTGGSWYRYIGVAGILSAAALLAAGIVVAPLPTATGDTANKVASALISNLGAARLGGFLNLVATIPFIVFAAGVTDILSRGETVSRVLGRVAFGCAIAAVVLYAAGQSVLFLAAGIAQGSAPETVRAVYGVWDSIGFTGHVFLGLFVLTISVLALMAHVFPRWVRWTGLVGGTCLSLGTLALSGGLDVLGPLFLIGWYVSLVSLLIASIWILLGKVAAQPLSTESGSHRPDALVRPI